MAAHPTTDIEDLGRVLARRDFPQCNCPDCASLCHGLPGIYDPGHLNHLLAADGASLAEMAPHLVEDYYLGDEVSSLAGGEEVKQATVFYLRPRTSDEAPGGLASMFPTAGSCSRLGPRGGTLARDEMPIGCMSAFACRPGPGPGAGPGKAQAVEMWDTEEGRDLVRRFEAESRRQTPEVALGLAPVVMDQLKVAMLGPMGQMMMTMQSLQPQARRQKARGVIARIQASESARREAKGDEPDSGPAV